MVGSRCIGNLWTTTMRFLPWRSGSRFAEAGRSRCIAPVRGPGAGGSNDSIVTRERGHRPRSACCVARQSPLSDGGRASRACSLPDQRVASIPLYCHHHHLLLRPGPVTAPGGGNWISSPVRQPQPVAVLVVMSVSRCRLVELRLLTWQPGVIPDEESARACPALLPGQHHADAGNPHSQFRVSRLSQNKTPGEGRL